MRICILMLALPAVSLLQGIAAAQMPGGLGPQGGNGGYGGDGGKFGNDGRDGDGDRGDDRRRDRKKPGAPPVSGLIGYMDRDMMASRDEIEPPVTGYANEALWEDHEHRHSRGRLASR